MQEKQKKRKIDVCDQCGHTGNQQNKNKYQKIDYNVNEPCQVLKTIFEIIPKNNTKE